MSAATTMITLTGANHFFCSDDEAHFFGWLKAIPAVRSVGGRGRVLDVAVSLPVDDESLRSLLGLLARYGVAGKPLRTLCSLQNERWFKDPEKYWFASVFEESA